MKNALIAVAGFVLGVVACAAVFMWSPTLLERAASTQREVDPAKFEDLRKAATTAKASIGVGVTYTVLGDLVRGLAVQTELARGKASTPEERQLIRAADEATQFYQDSLHIWQQKIEYGSVLAPYQARDVEAYAKKYNVAPYSTGNFRADDIIQAAWVRAEAALSPLIGGPPVATR